MGPDSAYYIAESLKYPGAFGVNCTIEAAQLVANEIRAELCASHSITTFPAVIVGRNRNSRVSRFKFDIDPKWSMLYDWFRAGMPNEEPSGYILAPDHYFGIKGTEKILLSNNMLDWGTVAHELAHALHSHNHHRRFWLDRAAGKPLDHKLEKWHGNEHAYWMAQCIDKLCARNLVSKTLEFNIRAVKIIT